jgi:uncharacterized protein (DUF1499 family)
MPTSQPGASASGAPVRAPGRRWIAARAITLALAVGAFVLLIVSGPGTRSGWWSWGFGLTVFMAAAVVGLAAAIAALILLGMSAFARWRARPWVPLVALCFALVALAPPLVFVVQATRVPEIHDITTDTQDPPAFVALLGARKKSPNGADYGGPEIAAQQRAAYPDVKPLVLQASPRDTMQKAIDAARAMGWEVVASDAAEGRIEATARTRWFGFSDDIVVRIRPQGSGSRVDARSVSRVGESDVGANAARLKEFLGRL